MLTKVLTTFICLVTLAFGQGHIIHGYQPFNQCNPGDVFANLSDNSTYDCVNGKYVIRPGVFATGIYYVTTHITAAQILAAHTTPIQLVPSPVDANKSIVALSTAITYHKNTTDFLSQGPAFLYTAGGAVYVPMLYTITTIPNFPYGGSFSLSTYNSDGIQTQDTLFGLSPASTAGFPLMLADASNYYNQGGILTSHKTANGSGYAPGDTGTISGGRVGSLATYTIDTVSTGAVATYHITAAGVGYSAASIYATTHTTGSGTGFTLTVDTVTVGNGSFDITIAYYLAPIQ